MSLITINTSDNSTIGTTFCDIYNLTMRKVLNINSLWNSGSDNISEVKHKLALSHLVGAEGYCYL